jgi:hypothetical protein
MNHERMPLSFKRASFSFPLAVFLMTAVSLSGCAPPDPQDPSWPEETIDPELPPNDLSDPYPYVQAPGGAYLDIQCQGKHSHHPIDDITHKGARFSNAGGTETFEHLNITCNRVEVDTNDHYKTGVHTFEGEVKIGDVSGQSVVQIFNAPSSGPILMIKAYDNGGGTLKKLAGSVQLISGATNEWVRVRIVHNLNANTLTVYINGDRKWSGPGGKGGSFNLKYGNYGTGAPTKVQWRNVSW